MRELRRPVSGLGTGGRHLAVGARGGIEYTTSDQFEESRPSSDRAGFGSIDRLSRLDLIPSVAAGVNAAITASVRAGGR